MLKEKEIKHYQEISGDLASKQEFSDAREREFEIMINHKDLELAERDRQKQELQQQLTAKQLEIDELDQKLMNLKDERLDYEAKVDKRMDQESSSVVELAAVREQLSGKDQAIKALSGSLMQKAQEHEKMSEMVSQFKNKLIYENCFHTTYGVKRKMGILGKTEEFTISFMRDRSFEEEFFLVIEAKDFNPKTGCRDKRLIAVDDVDEIEHTGGLGFAIHFQDYSAVKNQKTEAIKGAIGGLVKKMKKQ